MRAIAFAIALTALSSAAAAQSQSAGPEEVVRRFFETEIERNWLNAAHFLDLNAFDATRRAAIESGRHQQPVRKLTVDQIMQFDPDMPREVAEYQVKEANKDRTFDLLEREYARVSSVDELAALPIDEAAARWLEAKDLHWQMTLAMKYARSHGRRVPPCAPPDSATRLLAKEVRPNPAQVIAVAYDKTDSLAYVLVRDPWRMRRASGLDTRPTWLEASPSIITLLKTAAGWKIYPAFDLPSPEGTRNVSVWLECDSGAPTKQ